VPQSRELARRIEKSRALFDQMVKAGLNPRLLNIGGASR